MRPRVILFWDNFAEYHYDRLASATTCGAKYGIHVTGVELIKKVDSHQWSGGAKGENTLVRVQESTPGSFFGWFLFVYRIFDVVTALDPKVVFVPSYWPARPLLVLLVSRVLGVPAVMMNESHGGSARATGFGAIVKIALLKLFSSGFVAGAPHARYFQRLGFKKSCISVGYSAIDGAAFRARLMDSELLATLHRRFRCPGKCILSLGRLVAKKNLETLIKAYVILLDVGETAPPLVFVGEGVEKINLQKLCVEEGVPFKEFSIGVDLTAERSCICFYPFCKNAEAVYFYSQALLFVLPSIVEEWGLVVNEAVASLVPVIVSENAGCAEDLVEEGVNGFRFAPMDKGRLAALMAVIISDLDLQDRLKEGARRSLHKVQIEVFGEGFVRSIKMGARHIWDERGDRLSPGWQTL